MTQLPDASTSTPNASKSERKMLEMASSVITLCCTASGVAGNNRAHLLLV